MGLGQHIVVQLCLALCIPCSSWVGVPPLGTWGFLG